MVASSNVDTKAAVSKFLTNRSVVDKEDKTADSADEVQIVLESVALSFLLYPQAALSFIIRAKNVLQQVVATDLSILSYIIKTIGDIENPDEPITDTSDLSEAQVALVEVDRLGRISSDIKAYDRYTQAINRFLDKKLASSLKRHRRSEFERTGNEAKQDLFRVLSVFSPIHDVMISRISSLLNSVSDFNSVELSRIVSTKALTKVRASLDKVIKAANKNQASKTAIAIELLAGSSALGSIANTRKIYDPTVETGIIPSGRTITISSERVPATGTGTTETVDLSLVPTPWIFGLTVDSAISGGTSYSIILPAVGASGRSYVKATSGGSTYDIPIGNKTLYVQFNGIAPPLNEPVRVRTIVLPTGSSVSIASILSALNHVSTGLIDGTAVELFPGSGQVLIYGSASVTGIVVRAQVAGSFDISGNFIPAPGSVHSILGFSDDQASKDPNIFTPSDLINLISPIITAVTLSIDNDAPVITSNSTELLSSLSFSGVANNFGFTDSRSLPTFLELEEFGSPIDPTSLGVFIGSIINVTDISGLISNSIQAPISEIDETHIKFAPEIILPRITSGPVKIISPIVFAIQKLLNNLSSFSGIFNTDSRELQRVLSPLLSKPTLAQINDAVRSIQLIQNKVNNLSITLANAAVRLDRSEFESIAAQITASLEERSLDRALELLQIGQFSSFFNLTKEDASKSTRFLKASEQVGRNEFARPTSEQDREDLLPKGTTPDKDILSGQDLLENEEQV